MIGVIYCIKNTVNNNVYIGKTYKLPSVRFKEHISNSIRFPNRSLYKAMNNLGLDKFYIEEIGKYNTEFLEEKEQEYIAEYKSFINGYNDTPGGEGKKLYTKDDENFIIQEYNILGSAKAVSKKLGVAEHTISKILRSHNALKSKTNIHREIHKCPIIIYDRNLIFDSIQECADFLIKQGLTKGTYKTITGCIHKVINGKRKSYLGLKFGTY